METEGRREAEGWGWQRRRAGGRSLARVPGSKEQPGFSVLRPGRSLAGLDKRSPWRPQMGLLRKAVRTLDFTFRAVVKHLFPQVWNSTCPSSAPSSLYNVKGAGWQGAVCWGRVGGVACQASWEAVGCSTGERTRILATKTEPGQI